MKGIYRRSLAALAFAGGLATATAMAASEVRIGVVNDYAGWNPYADSTAQMYMTWCQTYGCLGTYDTRENPHTDDEEFNEMIADIELTLAATDPVYRSRILV